MKQNLSIVTLIFTLTASALMASAQTGGSQSNSGATPQSTAEPLSRTSADESFDLNITERRITERDFAASTTVEAGEETARGLRLRVGVEVGADAISVLLRNVRGHVRFRATLDRVIERLNARSVPGAAP